MQYYPIKYFIPHMVFFGAYIVALIPILYYYRRRGSHPRFRPGVGEMTMITVFALVIGGTACWHLGNLFRGEQSFSNSAFDHGAGWSKDTNAAPQEGDSGNYRTE